MSVESGCEDKRIYETWRQACLALRRIARSDKTEIDRRRLLCPYFCPHCRRIHIGHTNKRRR